MSPYTTPIVVSVSGSNARAEGRDRGGAVIGAGSRASAMFGLEKTPAKIRCPVDQRQMNSLFPTTTQDSTYHHSGHSHQHEGHFPVSEFSWLNSQRNDMSSQADIDQIDWYHEFDFGRGLK